MSEQDSREQTIQALDETQSQEASQVADTATGVRIASDEEVRRASEKVFRLHSRLFEALAK